MEIDEKIETLQNYSKALGTVSFGVFIGKNGECHVRLRKKYNIAIAPTAALAGELVSGLTEVVKKQQKRIDDAIGMLSVALEQMDLFK